MAVWLDDVQETLARHRANAAARCEHDCREFQGKMRHGPNCPSPDILELCSLVESVMEGDLVV